MANPTPNELAIEKMGHVKEKVTEYSNKPSIPPRKSRFSNEQPQNGSPNSNVSPPVRPRTKTLDRKLRKSQSVSVAQPSFQTFEQNSGPPAIILCNEDSKVNNVTLQKALTFDESTGPPAMTLPYDNNQVNNVTLQEAVYTMDEQKYETVTEKPLNDIKEQISDNSSNQSYSVPSKSPSPANLDSSFDETSDEDVITDRVMGKDVVPEEPISPLPPKPEKKSKAKTRERSTVIVKSDVGSLSPVERRKNLQALSSSFKPSTSVSRSQTFTEPSPRQKRKMQQPPGSPLTVKRSSASSNNSPLTATNLSDGFVFLESEEVCAYLQYTV